MNKFNFTVISFFTPNYQAVAEKLEASCQRYDIPNQIIPSAFKDKSKEDWRRNTFAKAEFIKSQMARIPGPLVWIDADAIIKRPPILFNNLIGLFCIAAYSRIPGRIRSGTIWFANDQLSQDIVDLWIKINSESFMIPGPPMAPDEQKHLSAAIAKLGGESFFYLPLSYCRIKGSSRDDHAEIEDPVILHFQKSRDYRGLK